MSLTVTALKATDVPNLEWPFSKSDPICIITFREKQERTEVVKSNLNPTWTKLQDLTWSLDTPLGSTEVLKVGVYDHEAGGWFRPLGFLDLPLHELAIKKTMSVDTNLTDKEGARVKGAKKAKIQLQLTYSPPAHLGKLAEISSKASPELDRSVSQMVSSGATGVLASEVLQASEGPGAALLRAFEGSDGTNYHYEGKTKEAKPRTFPDKEMDFQVRVHIIEARKLEGVSITPVVKVVCGKVVKGTNSVKGTSSPFFDELLFYNFHERPSQLMARELEIRVMNAKSLRSTALIGTFKLDMQTVENEPDHSFQHKWLLLTNPKDSVLSVKGYLKVSIFVLAPGDEPALSPSLKDPEEVDIESNLLRPVGIQLQPATLTVRVYRAEDLPQMDPDYIDKAKKIFGLGKKSTDLVDPYCCISYGGHKARTQHTSNESNPEWNFEASMGVRFPSMCEKIQFQVMDKDSSSWDDYIGTCSLNISDISVLGSSGFLPTFGPCYVNIYGSPREFSVLPDKYELLNKGKAEGVSYRGRVMVEVGVSLERDSSQGADTGTQFSLEKWRVEPKFWKKNFQVRGVFFTGNMVHPSDAPVQFEVSIGNFGNKLDERALAQNSSTPEKTPVPYGNGFHFIPWKNEKPCVVVDSYWEDSRFRIQAQNMLNCIADRLERGVADVRKLMEESDAEDAPVEAEAHEPVSAQEPPTVTDTAPGDITPEVPRTEREFIAVLTQFMGDIESHEGSEVLPKLPLEGAVTKLDRKLKQYREKELKSLLKNAANLHQNIDLTLTNKLEECDCYVAGLRDMAKDPQNSIPDVVIWMLSGGKRVASHRIPAHLLMYSDVAKKRGKFCGKIQTIYLQPPSEKVESTVKDKTPGAQLRVLLWLGPDEEGEHWLDDLSLKDNVGKKIGTYAELYEEQKGSGHKWVDASVSFDQAKKKLENAMPEGWEWDPESDWSLSPELSIQSDPDSGKSEVTEEVYENQSRSPFAKWPSGTKGSYWTDKSGNQLVRYEGDKRFTLRKEEIQCPEGWEWENPDGRWEICQKRNVNKQGWEFALEAGLHSWGPSETKLHCSRRRKWTRVRVPSKDKDSVLTGSVRMHNREGWEYARHLGGSYHILQQQLDVFRRRRYLRKLYKPKNDSGSTQPLFQMGDKEEQLARQFLLYKDGTDKFRYQLRVYLYQARDMYGSDRSGLSDPYVVISFDRYTDRTCVLEQTVSPKWDQSFLFHNVSMYGDPSVTLDTPPSIVIKFYDQDQLGADEYLGRVDCTPSVKGNPQLEWYNISRNGSPAGQVLAAFELKLEDGTEPDWETKTEMEGGKEHYIVPKGIRPELQLMRVEILCWGVRDMKRYQLLPVLHPYIRVECDGAVEPKETLMIKDASRNPNFPGKQPRIVIDKLIPRDALYAPPLNIHIFEKRSFGRTLLIGSNSRSLKKYIVETPGTALSAPKTPPTEHVAITMETAFGTKEGEGVQAVRVEDAGDPDAAKLAGFDWWSRFYYFSGERSKVEKEYKELQPEDKEGELDQLMVYERELEDTVDIHGDLETFPLFHGKGSRDPNRSKEQVVGHFKGAVKVYPLPEGSCPPSAFTNFPSPNATDIIVRVYVVKGVQLQPQDLDGNSDPYIKITVGKHEISGRDSYIPGDLNPTFGQMFEVPATLPFDRTLTVTVMDWDRLTTDDLIGSTEIDLEDRFFSPRRARWGLPREYYSRGTLAWRDDKTPVQILEKNCVEGDIQWAPNEEDWVMVEGTKVELDEGTNHPDLGEKRQRLALKALREVKHMIPEHVETRNLYNPLYPEISQGSLKMWVEIIPKKDYNPRPLNISPRKPETYILRVVAYKVTHVEERGDRNLLGQEDNDLYIKGWLQGQNETQKTDIHYRSLGGEGYFNWRLVFPFQYNPKEKVMVVKKKEHFYSLTETERVVPGAPHLTLQVYDSDVFSSDDYLGTAEFDLSCMYAPRSRSSRCDVNQLFEDEGGRARRSSGIDLFKKRRLRGWWPAYKHVEGQDRPRRTGRLELEVELLTEKEAAARPAGKGREEPNKNPHLDKPNRPVTSFLWFTSPWKTFRHVIWKRFKGPLYGAACCSCSTCLCMMITPFVVLSLLLFLLFVIISV